MKKTVISIFAIFLTTNAFALVKGTGAYDYIYEMSYTDCIKEFGKDSSKFCKPWSECMAKSVSMDDLMEDDDTLEKLGFTYGYICGQEVANSRNK